VEDQFVSRVYSSMFHRARNSLVQRRILLPHHLQQRRELLLPLIPIAVVGGAAAFFFITWSQVREKRAKREAEALKASTVPGKDEVKEETTNDKK